MRIAKHPTLTTIDKLEAGACFLFQGSNATEVGIVVDLGSGEKGILSPGPSDPSVSMPQVYQDYTMINDVVAYLPGAMIVVPDTIDQISFELSRVDYTDPYLIYTREGIYLRAVYRRVNLLTVNVLNGSIVSASLVRGMTYTSWAIATPAEDNTLDLVKSFGKKSGLKFNVAPSF